VKRDEQQIHKAVVQHLRLRGVKGLMFWHTPNSLAIPGRKGAILGGINKSLGVFQGVSDLLLFHKSQLYALELKVDAGHVTPSQARFIEDLVDNGGLAQVARGIDQALEILKDWKLIK
jgi:hypothetical protein